MSLARTLLRSVLALLLAVAVGRVAAAEPPARQVVEPAEALSLRYRAFIGGAPVGEADVQVSLIGDTYRVTGTAESNGWLERFSRWRNEFTARGRWAEGQVAPAEFGYTESDRDKHRRLVVRDGVLQVTKNGKQRPERRSPPGADVVSALFVQPHCADGRVIHTGRHVYRLTRLDAGAGICRYRVVDDDDDSFEVELELARRGSLVVPEKITVHAWLTGRVELTAAEPVAPGPMARDSAAR